MNRTKSDSRRAVSHPLEDSILFATLKAFWSNAARKLIGSHGKAFRTALVTGALVPLLNGCATFHSSIAQDGEPISRKPRNGVYYFLPKARIQLHGEFGKDADGKPTKDFLITVARLNEPDRSHRYLLEHTFNPVNDDDTGFTVDEHGLVQGAMTMHSTGRTGEIIETIGETFLTLADAAARGAYLAGGTATAIPAVYPFTVTFDPLNQREVLDVQSQLHQCLGAGSFFELESRTVKVTDSRRKRLYPAGNHPGYPSYPDAGSAKAVSSVSEAGPTPSRGGVYFHPLTTVRIVLGGYQANSYAFFKSHEIAVPDPEAVAVFPFTRPALVEKSVSVTFKDGEPQVVKYTYPSEALALVKIPKKLAEDLLSQISQFTTFVNTNKPFANTQAANANDLFTNQAAATERQAALIRNLQALQALQHPVTPAPVATPAPLP